VSNPLEVRDGREIAVPVPNSGAELLQEWAPGARIVKAFNTVNFRVMKDPAIAGGPVSVPLSGDDEAAKARVAVLVRGIGLDPVDVGPLRTARYTENMALLYVSLLVRGGTAYEYYLRPRP
jgi:predicted dinucleotide-binding enzyme